MNQTPQAIYRLSRKRWLLLGLIGAFCAGTASYGLINWTPRAAEFADLREQNRVREGQLPAGHYPDDIAVVVAKLSDVRPYGIRFTAEPSLGWGNYAVVIEAPNGQVAHGDIVVVPNGKIAGGRTSTRHFVISAVAYATMARKIDRILDRVRGLDRLCGDGTNYTVERVTPGRTRWVTGHCGSLSEEIGNVVFDTMRDYAPGIDLPSDKGWYPNPDIFSHRIPT